MHMGRYLFCTLLLSPAPAVAQAPAAPAAATGQAAAQTPSDRFQDFLDAAVLSPTPYLLSLGGAILDQFGKFPEEWTGGRGFGKRYLARQGMSLTSDAVGHSVAAVIHHRVIYDPCTCKGFARVKHAMGRAFVSRTDSGGSSPNYSLWIAKFSAAGLANTWYPDSYQKGDIIREGGVGIAVSGGLNILKEFSPELLRIAHIK